jgi:hypothetical protein
MRHEVAHLLREESIAGRQLSERRRLGQMGTGCRGLLRIHARFGRRGRALQTDERKEKGSRLQAAESSEAAPFVQRPARYGLMTTTARAHTKACACFRQLNSARLNWHPNNRVRSDRGQLHSEPTTFLTRCKQKRSSGLSEPSPSLNQGTENRSSYATARRWYRYF